MAILFSDDFSFEFHYRDYADKWLYYEMYFKWKGEPIINDSVLKRASPHWKNRPDSAIIAKEWKQDGLIPVLKKVLAGEEACCWKPSEPDLVIAIYPDRFFPDFYHEAQIRYFYPEMQAEHDAREKEKKEKGILPDSFLFMPMLDTHAFTGSESFSGQGLSVPAIYYRKDLALFLKSLESEYQEFRNRFNLPVSGEK